MQNARQDQLHGAALGTNNGIDTGEVAVKGAFHVV